MLILTILLSCSSLYNSKADYVETPTLDKEQIQKFAWNYVYSLARVQNSDYVASLYAKYTIKYADKYRLNPFQLAKQGYAESGLVHTNISCAGARGAWQIIPLHWSHLLYHISGGKLVPKLRKIEKSTGFTQKARKRLTYLTHQEELTFKEEFEIHDLRVKRKNYLVAIRKFFYVVDYNCEMAAIIMKEFLSSYNGNLKTALMAYRCGPYSKHFRDYQRDPSSADELQYIRYVTDDHFFHKELDRLTPYRYIERI